MSPPEQSGSLAVLCTRGVRDALRDNPAATAVDRLGEQGAIEFLLDEDLAEADEFRSAEMLSLLQPRVACRVEVLGDGRTLEDVERWIDAFRVRIQQGLSETRSNEFRLVLVLCWLDLASQDDLSRVEAFGRGDGGLAVKVRDSRLVRRIYALDGRLNDAPGVGSGLFSARDCWTVAVDRLLMRLRMPALEESLARSEAPIRAWRFAEIAAPWTTPACEAIRREVWRRHRSARVEDWPPPIRLLGDRTDPPPIQPMAVELPRFADPGPSYRPTIENSLTGSSRIQSQLESAVDGVGAMWPLEAEGRRVSASIWSDVRARRERLELLKNAKAESRGGRDELARHQIEWIGRYLQQSDEFERSSADLEEAADELDLARQTWVAWPLRIAGAIAISLVVAYAVYGLVRPVSGSAMLALGSTTFIVAAISAAAGAVSGALLPWWFERRSGNVARAELQQHSDAGTGSLHELAAALRRGVTEASRLRLATWEESLAARIRRLGRRGADLCLRASNAAAPNPIETDHRTSSFLAASRIAIPEEAFDGVHAEDFIDAGESRLGEHLQIAWDRMLGEEDRRHEGLFTTPFVARLSRSLHEARHEAERSVARALFANRFDGVDFTHRIGETLRRRLKWMGESRRPLLSVRLGVTDAGVDHHERIAAETSAFLLDSDSLRKVLRYSWPDESVDPLTTAASWPMDSPVETVGLFVEECVVVVDRVSDDDLEDGDLGRTRPRTDRLKWILGESLR